jgi:hypothetical protein
MRDCERCREQLLRGDGPGAHEESCQSCRDLARALAADNSLLREAHEAATPPPPNFEDVLLRAGRGNRAGGRVALLAGAMAALALLASIWSPGGSGPMSMPAETVAANPFSESEDNPFLELASALPDNPFEESTANPNPFLPASASTGEDFLFEADQRRF